MADSTTKNPNENFERPSTALVQRKAKIQFGKVNTLRFPGDLEKDDPSPWFNGTAPLSHTPTNGNDVQFLVDGPTAISTMMSTISQTSTPGDYVLMLNWWGDPFISPSGQSLGQLLATKLALGVQVRGMFWRMFMNYADWPLHNSQNEDMVTFLNRGYVERSGQVIQYLDKKTPPHSRRNGAAIFDARLNRINTGLMATGILASYASVGSHHHKLMCVKAGNNLTAFCGGIDFNDDRLGVPDKGKGQPLHDVHCRVVGPAAANLAQTFVDRWTDHPEGAILDGETGKALVANIVRPADLDTAQQPQGGRHKVQMGRTFGAGPLLNGPDGQGTAIQHYRFAPQGEKTARALIVNAIRTAKKFIYLEDQYFVSLEAAQVLIEALNNGIKHLTVVVPHHKISDLPLTVRHRKACIDLLRAADPEHKRVHFFYKCGPNQTPGDYHTYVHSKMTIVDDVFAVVGTVNYNRRSWHYDSEVSLGIYDPSVDKILTNRFAHWLRMRMWAEHLFGVSLPPSPPDGGITPSDCSYAEVFDGVASRAQWLELIELEKKWLSNNPGKKTQDYDQSQYNSVAKVRPYNINEPPHEVDIPGMGIPIIGLPIDLLVSNYGWNHFLDPWTT
jgi:phosphatidylserine/phosphatidylglycerophosphate/cardiolipin synthase-like enzyme